MDHVITIRIPDLILIIKLKRTCPRLDFAILVWNKRNQKNIGKYLDHSKNTNKYVAYRMVSKDLRKRRKEVEIRDYPDHIIVEIG